MPCRTKLLDNKGAVTAVAGATSAQLSVPLPFGGAEQAIPVLKAGTHTLVGLEASSQARSPADSAGHVLLLRRDIRATAAARRPRELGAWDPGGWHTWRVGCQHGCRSFVRSLRNYPTIYTHPNLYALLFDWQAVCATRGLRVSRQFGTGPAAARHPAT